MSVIVFFLCRFASTPVYPLSLHVALPISRHYKNSWRLVAPVCIKSCPTAPDIAISSVIMCYLNRPTQPKWGALLIFTLPVVTARSEEHTSELQSRFDIVCRLLLEKKNGTN